MPVVFVITDERRSAFELSRTVLSINLEIEIEVNEAEGDARHDVKTVID